MSAARIVGVELRVAGFAEVAEDLLKKKLGHSTWVVWQVLCARRDRQGLTHITVNGIRNAPEFVAPVNLKRSLKRLKEAGLVENIGWQAMQVQRGRRVVTCDVFVRRIRGARQLSVAGSERVTVPAETKDWLDAAPGWGGKRARSGRKPGTANASGGGRQHLKNYPLGDESCAPNLVSSAAYPHGFHVRPPNSLNSMSKKLGCTGDSLSENHAPPVAGALVRFHEGENETGFAGAVKHTPPMPSTPLEGLPAYPGNAIVAPAQIPDPPKLTADDTEDYRVRLLASAFRGAVEQQYGKKCFLLSNVSPRAKSYVVLARAADILERYKIAPAAWCTFAVRRWYNARTHSDGYVTGAAVPLPPISVVFSPKQIEDRLSDERHHDTVAACAVGGRVVFGATHRKLLRRYADMRGALLRGMTKAEAVAAHFPGTLYDDMVEAARVEAVEIRNRFEDEIKKGRHVW